MIFEYFFKTKSMVFSNEMIDDIIEIKMDNNTIARVNYIQFLWVTIEHKKAWKYHTQMVQKII